MFSYGLGDAGTGLAATQLGFYLFPFFTGAAGLPAFVAGSLLMVIKVWDAFNDPIIGWLSDHTKSRWGPRLPWMIAGATPLGLSLAAVWWIPHGNTSEKTLYYVGITILLMTAYTSVNLPFSALSTELTEETNIRTRLNAARFTGSILAGLSGLIVAAWLLSSGNGGYVLMGRITGSIATLTTLISSWGLAPYAKKARRPAGKSEPFKVQLNRIIRNKIFIKIICLYLLLWVSLQLMQTVSIIYLEQVMKVPEEISKWIPIPFQISALLGLQFWSLYSNNYGRVKALYGGAILWIIACLASIILPPLSYGVSLSQLLDINNINSLKMFFLLLTIILIGFGASTAYLIPWSLLPDAIDSDPEKPAGIYTAWMVLIQKIGIGLSVQVLGLLLTFAGYQSNNQCMELPDCLSQPNSAITTIRICMGLIPSVLITLGLLLMRDWVDRKKTQQTFSS
ncbi:MFS transporter [Prochlorococcus sp. MIT 1223]|uniref:MFS transporter n=1 Tax=Prochlorococcus sp. MIT 1223 TaxID=3096217 RepID=UPI002A74AF29|nr:MFS transporter [Prochlorococcus sp. MIT 1223]